MSAIVYKLGLNGHLYYGTAGAKPTLELEHIKDVTVTLDSDMADVTTRANAGWKAEQATLSTCTMEFDLLVPTGDSAAETARKALRDAWLNKTTIALHDTDEDGEGVDGDFSISSFTKGSPLADAIKHSVKASLTVFRGYVEAGS